MSLTGLLAHIDRRDERALPGKYPDEAAQLNAEFEAASKGFMRRVTLENDAVKVTFIDPAHIAAPSLPDQFYDALTALDEAAYLAAKLARKTGHPFADDLKAVAAKISNMKDMA